MRAAAAVLRKDLRLELRTLETVPAMVLFSLATFVIFHFALNRETIEGQLAAGVLTATLLFASMLAVNRLFVAEREQGGFDAFLLAPVERNALLVAKAAALYLFLAVLELIAVPAFDLLLPPARATPRNHAFKMKMGNDALIGRAPSSVVDRGDCARVLCCCCPESDEVRTHYGTLHATPEVGETSLRRNRVIQRTASGLG